MQERTSPQVVDTEKIKCESGNYTFKGKEALITTWSNGAIRCSFRERGAYNCEICPANSISTK